MLNYHKTGSLGAVTSFGLPPPRIIYYVVLLVCPTSGFDQVDSGAGRLCRRVPFSLQLLYGWGAGRVCVALSL